MNEMVKNGHPNGQLHDEKEQRLSSLCYRKKKKNYEPNILRNQSTELIAIDGRLMRPMDGRQLLWSKEQWMATNSFTGVDCVAYTLITRMSFSIRRFTSTSTFT
ncbi:hypothetical protein LOAG_13288 [Loa loa]|uniref:Uncharacterized protein n=1 Tax=Loa loa TaxID=7209 RepID=A0A1S0TL36_LOALO|nr:hypothetical protein LOAG_13288 [Loa loa]EFO15224.1 hypothetical protein LOAG_13288 [Loa loa]